MLPQPFPSSSQRYGIYSPILFSLASSLHNFSSQVPFDSIFRTLIVTGSEFHFLRFFFPLTARVVQSAGQWSAFAFAGKNQLKLKTKPQSEANARNKMEGSDLLPGLAVVPVAPLAPFPPNESLPTYLLTCIYVCDVM